MTTSAPNPNRMPPHLSMDEYAEFVEASLRNRDPALVARQKELEERILVPFSLTEMSQPARRTGRPTPC